MIPLNQCALVRSAVRQSLALRSCAMLFAMVGGGATVATAQTERPSVHDPVMAKSGDQYYAFGTGPGIRVWVSPDLENWQPRPAVFEQTPDWVTDFIPDFKPDGDMWAPDIYFHEGTYYLYYSVSAFGRNNSAIGVATNTTLDSEHADYRWEDHGAVVNSVAGRDMWNAIDAHVTHDQEGVPWMSFGSHWGGIKLVRLGADLLRPEMHPDRREWHTIAARHRYWKLDDRDAGDSANPELDYDELYPEKITRLNRQSESGAIEAPFIFRRGDYYYLFVSWDRCCRGAESTYKIVVGRAPQITGPYVDRADQRLVWGGGTPVVTNFSESQAWAAGGHNSAYTYDGTDYLVFHAYEAQRGTPRLIVAPIDWDEQGWPTVTLEE